MAVHKYQENGKQLYRVHVKDRNSFGVQVNRSKKGVSSEARAKRLEIEFKLELLKLKEAPAVPLWNTWVEECIRRMTVEFKTSTVMNYRRNLDKWVTPHLKDKHLNKIQKSDIHDIVFTNIKGVSLETKHSVLKQVKRIFNMAVEENLIPSSPAKSITIKLPRKKQKCLNNKEIEVFLNAAYKHDHPWYAIWTVALMTGMRNGELHALKWTDIDFENKFLTVSRSWSVKNGLGTTKNGSSREVPISGALEKFLKELQLKSEGPYVLPRIKEWNQGDQAKIIREFCKVIGITEIKFHDLRATFITQMLIKDVAIARVMKIVGHATVKTTMGYLRLIAKDVMGATEALTIEPPSLHKEEAKVLSLVRI